MADRKYCSHKPRTAVVLRIEWCARCSGWVYRRYLVEPGSPWDGYFNGPATEHHYLPAETTDPYEISVLITRAMRAAQEGEQDYLNQ